MGQLPDTDKSGYRIPLRCGRRSQWGFLYSLNQPAGDTWTMHCACGESAKCVFRHPTNAERDEFKCDACGRAFLRYDSDRWTEGEERRTD
jgi:hypothetical protein